MDEHADERYGVIVINIPPVLSLKKIFYFELFCRNIQSMVIVRKIIVIPKDKFQINSSLVVNHCSDFQTNSAMTRSMSSINLS